jgi:GNAT superfamily N-acetyltransferase
MEFVIEELEPSDVQTITRVGRGNGWQTDPEFWMTCLSQHQAGERLVLVARRGADVGAYGTLVWRPLYAPFAAADTPEIQALVVAAEYRRQGIGTMMIGAFERAARAAGKSAIGIGVGLYVDYGPAQRLYARLGFVPDGSGASYRNEPIEPGSTVALDDDLTLHLVKPL